MKGEKPTLLLRIFRRLRARPELEKRLDELYRRERYLDAYSRHTDIRVRMNPHEAVGGNWEEMGRLQLRFLIANGLLSDHTLLDIGCGTLRGGRHFINYLGRGRYWGIDISPEAVEYARRLLQSEQLADKEPRLLINREKTLTFKEFAGCSFDFLIAQSVFTHLPPEHIEECFRNIGRVMTMTSSFFFTFSEASRFKRTGRKHFYYPFSYFRNRARENGFALEDRSREYGHPAGQCMVKATKVV